MNSLFTAFAGFTAFGAGIVAVLASGGAVQKMADRLASRAEREYPCATWCRLLDPIMIVFLTALVCLVVLGSGAGLLLSFLWLHAAGSGGWGWAYGVSVDLFECEIASMTLVTFVAVVAAAVTSVTKARRTSPSQGVAARGHHRDRPAGTSLSARLAEADRLSRREPRRPVATTRAQAGEWVTHTAASGRSTVQAARPAPATTRNLAAPSGKPGRWMNVHHRREMAAGRGAPRLDLKAVTRPPIRWRPGRGRAVVLPVAGRLVRTGRGQPRGFRSGTP